MDLKKYLKSKQFLLRKALDRSLARSHDHSSRVQEAMAYSLQAGGKRLRPILVMASAEACGKDASQVLPVACAVEFIHTYSLIHDDLPCMDDDDMRRGKPTCHKKFGEAVAVLAGDALLTRAFGILSESSRRFTGPKLQQAMQTLADLAAASGTRGLIGGQTADILNEGKKISLPLLKYIHSHKTGALLTACTRAGGIWTGATPSQLSALTRYGQNLGLAFQIANDILNVRGSSSKMGKGKGTDQQRKKVTYPAFYGLERSIHLAKNYSLAAVDCLANFGPQADPLRLIAAYSVERES